MKHLPSEKYNIAWFKLAECVSRGEKERALGVYKLLVHSLDDKALASQLLGDLLMFFKDSEAKERYLEAASIYEKSNKMIEAMAIYEHLLFLEPGSEECLFALLELYKNLNITSRFVGHVDSLITENKLDLAAKIAEKLDGFLKLAQVARLHRTLSFALMKQKNVPSQKVMHHVEKVLDGFVASKDNSLLQAFLSELQAVNEAYYTKARAYLEQGGKNP